MCGSSNRTQLKITLVLSSCPRLEALKRLFPTFNLGQTWIQLYRVSQVLKDCLCTQTCKLGLGNLMSQKLRSSFKEWYMHKVGLVTKAPERDLYVKAPNVSKGAQRIAKLSPKSHTMTYDDPPYSLCSTLLIQGFCITWD